MPRLYSERDFFKKSFGVFLKIEKEAW